MVIIRCKNISVESPASQPRVGARWPSLGLSGEQALI
jgi:hypothetical protein